MNENLLISIQISIVGMGLVFASILLLWGLMDLLMRVANRKEGKSFADSEVTQDSGRRQERKRRAAAAALALALAQEQESGIHEFPLPPTALVSAWQAVMRASNLSKRGPVR